MRQRPKLDSNQAAIIEAYRACGCLVQSLAPLGGGCPDLLIGAGPRVFLVEVKTAEGEFTPAQRAFMRIGWPVEIVRSVPEAVRSADQFKGIAPPTRSR